MMKDVGSILTHLGPILTDEGLIWAKCEERSENGSYIEFILGG
jgi:hypothetical protein